MRLYSPARQFLRVATHLYFVDVGSTGRKNVPDSGPVILAANHPSSILDGILLTTQLRRRINYLAKSELFRFPVLATLYRQLGAIPVYRSGQGGSHAERNAQVFQQVFEMLEAGACVGIFPEGRNSPRDQVADLRTGTARLALGAEARRDFRLGLRIVPTGLHFESRELFLSAVQLRFGKAIVVADYADLYRTDPEQAVRELTDTIQRKIRRQALHIQDLRMTSLLEDLGSIHAQEMNRTEPGYRSPEEEELPTRLPGRIRQRILDWFRPSAVDPEKVQAGLEGRHRINVILTGLAEKRPEALAALAIRVERYKAHLSQINLREDLRDNLGEPIRDRLIRLRMTLYAILMAPVALWGLIHNAIPYLISKLAAGRFRDEAVRGFAYFGIGVIAFSASYLAIGIWLWRFTDLSLPWTLAWVASLPPAGYACLRYRGTVLRYRDRILVRTFFQTEREVNKSLERERQRIITYLQALDTRYGLSEQE